MSLSLNTLLSPRPGSLEEPTTMQMPTEPVAWRRWADAMPDICLWVTPNTGRIVDCNRALFGTLGFTRTEVFGWPLQALAEPRHLQTAGATWRSLAACREMRDADCVLRARNGFELAVSATANPVHNDDGKLVAGLVVMRDITERRRREQTLQARKRQLKTLAYELTVAQARERSLLAHGLQDGVTQALLRARAQLLQLQQMPLAGQSGERSDAAALIAEMDTLLAGATQSVRSSVAELGNPLLERQGLQAAIEDLAQVLTREGPLVARVEGEIPAELEMPDATRAVLFRVLRELALNAARHANARHLWLRVMTEPERLSIVVGDDGCGFDVARLTAHANGEGGYGLFSADAHMQAIGGRLVVQSKPGRGTRAILVLPLLSTPMADTVSGASDTVAGALV